MNSGRVERLLKDMGIKQDRFPAGFDEMFWRMDGYPKLMNGLKMPEYFSGAGYTPSNGLIGIAPLRPYQPSVSEGDGSLPNLRFS